MAIASAKKTAVTYTLELTEREAKALCELLCASDFMNGEGEQLANTYYALVDEGVDHNEYQRAYDEDCDLVTVSVGDDE